MVKTKQKKRVTADVLTNKKTATKVKKHNPFEVHTNKEKFTIVGRQLKHDKGMPGVSRAKALKRRRDTLGQEYQQKGKANTFRDRRIGEQTMTREEAASARFIAERLHQQQKGNRKESLFNLNDDDDDRGGGGFGAPDDEDGNDVLTHKGQTLGEIEQFPDTRSDDDEADDDVLGKLDDQYTGAAHFGGGAADLNANDRKSAIKDMIADQKRRKEEISKEKEVVGELTHQLDEQWKTLLPLMAKLSKEDEKKPKPDAYDRALREMVFEPRGDVSDKLKSETELARAEKERLERLERERLERMSGVTEEEKKTKHRSADDLDDGYFVQPVVEEKGTLAYDINDKDKKKKKKKTAESDSDDDEGLFESAKKKAKLAEAEDDADNDEDEEESGEDEEEEDDDAEEEDSDEEESDDDNDSLNDLRVTDSENDETTTAKTSTSTSKKTATDARLSAKAQPTEVERQAIMRQAAAELPYTFELPDTYDELEAVLSNRNAEFQSVIIERMIKCNHPKIVPENKARMVTLFGYLLQHINDTFDTAIAATVADSFRVLERLRPHLYDLSQINPAETTQCYKEVIKEKQSDFRKSGLLRRYPSLDTLVFMQLAGALYSTSDYRHHIITPCYLFAGELLARCRIQTRADIACGLFLCTVLLEYAQLSKRFVPAALNFLAGVVFLSLRKHSVGQWRVVPPFRATGDQNSLLLLDADCSSALVSEKLSPLLVSDLLETDFDDAARVRLLHGALLLILDTLTLLEENIGASYFVAHIEQHLSRLDLDTYPAAIRQAAARCDALMSAIRARPLAYIVAAAKKPKALRLLEPAFDKVYDDKRSRRPGNKDKLVREGMLRKIKSETRGAIREIRRDNAFLTNIQMKKQQVADAERRDKVRRIFSEASVQQGELNAMDRKKQHM